MKTTVYILTLLMIASIAAGCSSGLATEPPPARCMVPPKPLGDIKPGEDVIAKYAELRRDKGEDSSKLRCTQAYIKALK